MTAGPYCQWCGQNCGCSPECLGPPGTEEVWVAFALDSGIEFRKVTKPYLGKIPEIEGFTIKYHSPGKTPYYDGRSNEK